MDAANVKDAEKWFEVLVTGPKTQTAVMRLAPGKASGPKGNEHPQSEQTLYVIRGELLAELGEEKMSLRAGDVVIVPAGVLHRFVNLFGSEAVTLNVYSPPAY